MMKYWMRLWVVGATLLAGCGNAIVEVEPSFYHWKTEFAPRESEHETMEQLHVGRLYVKYFDVDWAEDATRALPQAKVIFRDVPREKLTPTVFITNRAIQKTGEQNAPQLADQIFQLILKLHPAQLPAPEEIQIDCDWTQSTRAAYFALLERLHQRADSAKINLSATIRLHQIRYPELTGTPPVDRGMLMFYNMGDLDNPGEDNSILDLEAGRQYLDRVESYPLPLDVALPIFSWGVLIRKNKPIKLLNNLRRASVEGLTWVTEISSKRVRVDSSHYLGGHYLYAGDEIRLEEVSPEALFASADMLANVLPHQPRSVALYHLDILTLRHYRPTTLDSVFQRFK